MCGYVFILNMLPSAYMETKKKLPCEVFFALENKNNFARLLYISVFIFPLPFWGGFCLLMLFFFSYFR